MQVYCRTAAKYAFNSEYVPISDMRLITRRYGITFVDVKLIKMLFSDNRN